MHCRQGWCTCQVVGRLFCLTFGFNDFLLTQISNAWLLMWNAKWSTLRWTPSMYMTVAMTMTMSMTMTMTMMGEPAGGDKGFHVFHVAWVEGEDDQAGRWGILYLALSNVSIVQCFFFQCFLQCFFRNVFLQNVIKSIPRWRNHFCSRQSKTLPPCKEAKLALVQALSGCKVLSCHVIKGRCQKKTTGKCGNFSQVGDPPPPPCLGIFSRFYHLLLGGLPC